MKNKLKHVLILLLLGGSTLTANAQFYLGINAGYGFPTGGRTLQEYLLFDVTVDKTTFTNTATEQKASFGGGLLVSPVIGFKVNKYFGFELQGGRYKTNAVESEITYINPADDKVNLSMSGKVLTLRPSLIGYIHKQKPLVYAKAGGVYSNCEFLINLEAQKTKLKNTQLVSGGNSWGVSAGVGADWLLAKGFYLRTELIYVQANYFPKKGEYTTYEKNGVSLLNDMETDEKTINYVKEGYVEQTYAGAALEAGTHLSPQIPLSAFSLHVGIVYKFNNNKKK